VNGVSGGIYLAAYAGTIVMANAALAAFGVVPVGFGLEAPAGVYLAGLALTLRDLAQDRLGRGPIVAAIAVGAALSALVSPAFALASGAAFLASELADFAVYTPLRRRRGLLPAVLASNAVGLAVDSALFLALAFGSLDLLWGQALGKAWATLAAVAILAVVRRRDLSVRAAERG
jgi:uncharacterized PurR-regulated membrane protein YhhQ (DUF165 family)